MTNSTQRLMRRGRHPRGVSLIEGMVASVVLLIGLVGVLQGVIFASNQNAIAGRLTRAAAITRQTMMSIQAKGRARLVGSAGLLATANCTGSPDPDLQEAAGSLYPKTTASIYGSFTPCWVDLDTYDTNAAVADKILPGFPADEANIFKRTVVFYSNAAEPEISYVGVGLSWKELGQPRSHHQFFALYNSVTTETGGMELW